MNTYLGPSIYQPPFADKDLEFLQHISSSFGPGSASNFSVAIDSITLKSKSIIRPALVGVTAIVGGNNVGKSVLLRELIGTLPTAYEHEQNHTVLLSKLSLRRTGTSQDLIDWFYRHVPYSPQPRSGFQSRNSPTDRFVLQAIHNSWESSDQIGQLAQYFATSNEPSNRADSAHTSSRRPNLETAETHPLQNLESSPEIMNNLREVFRRTFHQDISLDNLGAQLSLRLGRTKIEAPPIDSLTREYQNAMSSLPQIADQGLGMKSVVGLMLPIIAATFPIIFVDEPEAFLHPPQAFQVGRLLAQIAKERQIQVILATHDKNILAGLLAADVDMSVVRLERKGNDTTANQLNPDRLRGLWSDPILRYTNILDGVFHRLVVVTEGDRDCRFYQAALDEAEAQSDLPLPASEVLFVPTSGKSAIARFVKELRAIGVETVACPDLDVLNEAKPLKALVEAFGESWEYYKDDYEACTQSFRGAPRQPTAQEFINRIIVLLKDHLAEPWSMALQKKVRDETKLVAHWHRLQEQGVFAFAEDEAATANKLLLNLARFGLRPVRVGVLESFAPDLNVSKGARWLEAAFAAGAHKSPEAVSHARDLVSPLD